MLHTGGTAHMRACALHAAAAGRRAPARTRVSHRATFRLAGLHPPPAAPSCPPRRARCLAAGDPGSSDEAADGGVTVEEDEEGGRSSLTGEELRELVVAKWGRPYDTRLCQRRNRFNELKMYLQVMWKFQGQKSFPVTAARYAEQLDAVAELLTEWGVVDEAVKGIKEATTTPSVDTVGATAVMIPLSVDVGQTSS